MGWAVLGAAWPGLAASAAVVGHQRLIRHEARGSDRLDFGEDAAASPSDWDGPGVWSVGLLEDVDSAGGGLSANATETVGAPLECNEFVHATRVAQTQQCPASCPFFAESGDKLKPCVYACVTATECGSFSANVETTATIPDTQKRYCRACRVLACTECAPGKDWCEQCMAGHYAQEGKCYHQVWIATKILGGVFVLTALYLIVWYIDLWCRPVVNREGMRRGLVVRSLSKLRQPKIADAEGSEARPLYPLSTNLLRELTTGGAGIILHFRFHVFWMAWAVFGLALWAAISASANPEIFKLGVQEVGTPLQLCRVMAWGAELQGDTMHVVLFFGLFLYLGTTCGTVIFAVMQQNKYVELDDKATMKDFAAVLTRVPEVEGGERVEQELKQAVEAASGLRVVGVSVAWDLRDIAEEVLDAMDYDLRSEQNAGTDSAVADDLAASTPLRGAGAGAGAGAGEPRGPEGMRWKVLGAPDRLLLWITGVASEPPSQKAPEELLREFRTTSFAFAVFESEADRDAAVEKLTDGFEYRGAKVGLRNVECEPGSVSWQNMGLSDWSRRRRVFIGVKTILLAIGCWGLLVYLPYMQAVQSLDYTMSEQEPAGASVYVMMLLLMLGNVALYFLCGIVAEKSGFRYQEHRETAYIVYYAGALLVCIILDTYVAGSISYRAAISVRTRLGDGQLLSSISDPKAIFDSYPVQKAMGFQLWTYVFPSTFLLPYMAEPFVLIYLPYHLMAKVVSTNPLLVGWRAERAMSIFIPYDLGRYADILANVTLTTLVFFVPAGYVHKVLVALFFSHTVIYFWDHYRVLRLVPNFTMALPTVDTFATVMSVVPCGVIAAAIFYRGNCARGSYCYTGPTSGFFTLCFIVFGSHCLLHIVALRKVAPRLSRKAPHKPTALTYAEVAKYTPATWFNVNPAWCIRSQHLYKHNPFTKIYVPGLEHTLKANPSIGQHFEDRMAKPEVYR